MYLIIKEATPKLIMINNIKKMREIIFLRGNSSNTDNSTPKSTNNRKIIVPEIKEHMMTQLVLIKIHKSRHIFVTESKNTRRKGIAIRRDLLKETEAIVLIKRSTTKDDYLMTIIKDKHQYNQSF